MGKKCSKCRGQKHMYRVGSAYSMLDTGGLKMDCPLCAGKGNIELPDYVKEAKEKIKKAKDKEKTPAEL